MVNIITPTTGIFSGISNEDYHSGAGVSKSDLDNIHRSPAHYVAAKLQPKEATSAMVIGAAIHSAILEPDLFSSLYAVAPNVDKRTKAGREEHAAFELMCANKGITPLTADQQSIALAVRDAVYAFRPSRNLLTQCSGIAEQSVYWQESDLLSECGVTDDNQYFSKCRPDYLRDDNLVVDVKSTEDARSDNFRCSVAKYRYQVQQAYYSAGLKAIGRVPRSFVFLAVEKTPPYGIGIFTLDDEAVKLGRMAYRADLESFVRCKMADYWPGYPEEVQVIDLPKWAA